MDINIQQDNIYIYHNGESLDQSDIERLEKIATHKHNTDKKGLSKQGIGWRAIASVAAKYNLQEDGVFDDDSLLNYSMMISKLKENVIINNVEQKKGKIISLIHDNHFQILFTSNNLAINQYFTKNEQFCSQNQ